MKNTSSSVIGSYFVQVASKKREMEEKIWTIYLSDSQDTWLMYNLPKSSQEHFLAGTGAKNIPITDKSPLLHVQSIHPDIKKEKSLSNKWQGSKGMPEYKQKNWINWGT